MLRLILSALLMFFLPGFTLINAVYPVKGELDEELDMLYRMTYGLGLSAAIVVLIGFILGHISLNGGKGLFVSETLTAGLILLTVLFFLIGWYRGGYQRLSYISPKLCRPKRDLPDFEEKGMEKVKKLQGLAKKRGKLKEKLRYKKRKIKRSEGEKKKRLEKEREHLREELEEIEKELKEAEKDREKDF